MATGARDGEQWRHARFGCVTGTDVARILGVDPSVSRRKLFECKLAHLDPTYNAGPYLKYLLEMGKIYEPLARDQFIECTRHAGYTPRVPGMEIHPTYPWLTGTPDLYTCGDDGAIRSIVEIKCHFAPNPHSAIPYEDKSDLPLKHWLQVQTYMEIKNVEDGYIWSWTLGNGATLFHVRRMEKGMFREYIIPMLSDFYGLLKSYYNPDHPIVPPKSALERLTFRRGAKTAIKDVLEAQLCLTVTFVRKFWPLKIPTAQLFSH